MNREEKLAEKKGLRCSALQKGRTDVFSGLGLFLVRRLVDALIKIPSSLVPCCQTVGARVNSECLGLRKKNPREYAKTRQTQRQ